MNRRASMKRERRLDRDSYLRQSYSVCSHMVRKPCPHYSTSSTCSLIRLRTGFRFVSLGTLAWSVAAGALIGDSASLHRFKMRPLVAMDRYRVLLLMQSCR